MSPYGYRLESPILAIEKYEDGRSTLRVLTPGTDLIVLSTINPGTGMVQIAAEERRLEVFQADLEDRASQVTIELRRPMKAFGS
jgi:hypothetical protein